MHHRVPRRLALLFTALLVGQTLAVTGPFSVGASVARAALIDGDRAGDDSAALDVAAAIPLDDPLALPSTVAPSLSAQIVRARRLWADGDLSGALVAFRQIAATSGVPPIARLQLGEVELASGDAAGARQVAEGLLASSDAATRARARLLIASADLSLGRSDEVPGLLDAANAPDGLADLAILLRARSAARGGQADPALVELRRPELAASTNRVILESAGQLADQLGAPDLAADLEARAGTFQGWTADRTRLIEAAARDYGRAGEIDGQIAQDRVLIESFGWTAAATRAGADLDRIGALGPYDRGLVAINAKRYDDARAALLQAASGPDAAAAARKLQDLDDAIAWQAAQAAGTPAAFHAFWTRHPASPNAAEALFQEGFALYQSGRYADAVGAWDSSFLCPTATATPSVDAAFGGADPCVSAVAPGSDVRSRLLFWQGKALDKLGLADAARSRWQAATSSRPAGYYAVRAGDLLDGTTGWPTAGTVAPSDPRSEGVIATTWLETWAGSPATADPATLGRVRRALGLLALGYPRESEAELNGLIAESRDPWLLYRLSGTLAQDELWSSSARAANRLVALAPDKSILDAPRAIQRLAYPPAYLDLVRQDAAKVGIDPTLFQSLLYQESGGDPYALSISDARGLTQVLPSTGRGIAAAVGLSGFTPDDLYRPSVAVRLGTWFLANQLSSFHGDPFRAIAAYNSGAGPISRWAAADPDVFVERISYAETKDYVRKIYVHDAVYRSLITPRRFPLPGG